MRTAGLAATLGGALVLPAMARPTEAAGVPEDYLRFVTTSTEPPQAPTADNVTGPFHRPGAPFRAKLNPPLEPGTPLVINGRVWGADTRRPLPGATLDIWHADASGEYDNSDPDDPPPAGLYRNRARLIADESGYYEYETIHPGHYPLTDEQLRASHIHYLIRYPGYRALVTQLFFEGDPHNDTDPFVKDPLIITLKTIKAARGVFETGTFDIVLAKT